MLDVAQPLRFGVGPDVSAIAVGTDEPPLTKDERKRAKFAAAVVRRLPDDGALLIVHCQSVVPLYRSLIRTLRGETVANNTRVIAAQTARDEEALLPKGGLIPVFHDAFVQASRDHRRSILQAARL